MIKVGSARIDERGKIIGGMVGDQTGREVAIEPYYVHPQGWWMLRAKDKTTASKIAQVMREACANTNIGYDQSGRYGIISNLKMYGRIAKIRTETEADCSSLVRACCIQASIRVGDFNTSSEVSVLSMTGKFDAPVSVIPSTKLCEGDIMVTKTKGHTVIVTESYKAVKKENNPTTSKDISTIAKEVIQGKWGVGNIRKSKLTKAGYDYKKVQAEINALLSS